MTNERVLVIKDRDIENITKGYGFLKVPIDEIKNLAEKRGFFVQRSKAENDESIRQLIPYVVVQNTDGMYLFVKRLKTQTEKRLHELYSIGIGGHINDQDEGSTPWMKFLSGMEREINEEILIKTSNWPQYIGMIRENSTPVNRVHLGVVFTLTGDIGGIREVNKFIFDFSDLQGLMQYYDQMETWSQLVLNEFQHILKKI